VFDLILLDLKEARAALAKHAAPAARKPGIGIGSRIYNAAKASRLTSGWPSSDTSADSELASSLRILRNRSRSLGRDAPYARRAKEIVKNNVVGSGIGMQAQVMTARGDLNDRVNDEIEEQWQIWMRPENCHTGRAMHFSDLERAAMGQVFEAGEIFIRKYASAIGPAGIPLALEFIEPERIADELQPTAIGQNLIRLGVEQDEFYRAVAYYIRTRHPGEISLAYREDRIERVLADLVFHLRIVDRWPQTRGEPWLHAVARKLNDMDGYSEAEIVAARGAASYMGTIKTQDTFGTENPEGTGDEVEIEAGLVARLQPGEEFTLHAPNRPNAAIDPFMRMMLREVASGVGVSYESLSRDYSQSNYSSSRLSLLDDRDLWRVLQLWFIRSFREPLHRLWLQQAVLSGAIRSISAEQYAVQPEKFEAVRFKPRGWSWIDPTKEVAAAKEAILAGLTTRTHVIAQTADGRDVEDVDNERLQEIENADEKGLQYDVDNPPQTGPSVAMPSEEDMPPAEGTMPTGGKSPRSLLFLRKHPLT
jgi:lambda family phage portal protein